MINGNDLTSTLVTVTCLGVLLVACSGSADPALAGTYRTGNPAEDLIDYAVS